MYLTSRSTLTTWPRIVTGLIFLILLFPFQRQGLRLDFPWLHPGHSRGETFASSLGRLPATYKSLMMLKLVCPRLSWIVNKRICFSFYIAILASCRAAVAGVNMKSVSIGSCNLVEASSSRVEGTSWSPFVNQLV